MPSGIYGVHAANLAIYRCRRSRLVPTGLGGGQVDICYIAPNETFVACPNEDIVQQPCNVTSIHHTALPGCWHLGLMPAMWDNCKRTTKSTDFENTETGDRQAGTEGKGTGSLGKGRSLGITSVDRQLSFTSPHRINKLGGVVLRAARIPDGQGFDRANTRRKDPSM